MIDLQVKLDQIPSILSTTFNKLLDGSIQIPILSVN